MNQWHVLGAGAMGCLFSQQLAAAGCAVTLIQRASARSSPGFLQVADENTVHRVAVTLTTPAEAGLITKLLVTVKAPDIEIALRSLQHRIAPQTDIVLAANGMGFIDTVRQLLPANRLFCCVTTEGAHRLAHLQIRHAGRGVTRIGAVGGDEKPDWLADWLTSPLDCAWENNIGAALWQKLAINCAINPLTALHRCNNGALKYAPLREEVRVLCEEIACVSRARGHSQTAAALYGQVSEVIEATAENRSSMLQDIESGRSTEIAFITGFLVQEAQRLGIAVPANQALLQAVQAIAP